MQSIKLIAKPLITLDKVRKVTPREQAGTIYLLITPKRYIGKGATLEEAISDANARTFSTGYRVVKAQ